MRLGILLGMASAAFVSASCAEQYTIAGNASVSTLDGKMLYLKSRSEGGISKIDSCEVVHGKFSFSGKMDSAMMAEIFLDNTSIMPVVIEMGDVVVDISLLGQKAYGGTLNERLYSFLEAKSRLDSEKSDMALSRARLMMKGFPLFQSQRMCEERSRRIEEEADSLEVEFIRENYDNVLGPEIFGLVCSRYRYPVITEQISKILEGAPRKFRNHPIVREYVDIAEKNMALLNRQPRRESVFPLLVKQQ